MQPALIKEDGTQVALSGELYRMILRIVQEYEEDYVEPAQSFEEIEAEFADLFVVDGLSTADLLEEHQDELEREDRKLIRFGYSPRRNMNKVLAEIDTLPPHNTPPSSPSVEETLREDRDR